MDANLRTARCTPWVAQRDSAADPPSFALWRGAITLAPVDVTFDHAGCDSWENERHTAKVSEDEDIPVALPGGHADLPGNFSFPLTSLDPLLTAQSVKRPGHIDLGSNRGSY